MAPLSLPAQLVRTRRFSLGVPGRFTVAADGGTVLFLRSRAEDDPVACLWALDPDSGAERVLADPARLLGADSADGSDSSGRSAGRSAGTPEGPPGPGAAPGAGITGYATDRGGGLAAFALGGALWTVTVAEGRVRRLPATGPPADPRPDPSGRRIAYVHGGALRVIGADGSGDRAVAVPYGPDVAWGVAEHTDATSVEDPRGYWWAPDGERLLVARVDRSAVGVWHVADPSAPERPPRVLRYAAAGTPNAEVTLWIARLGGARARVRWDRAAHEYVVGAGWDAHGPYAVVQSRDQRTVRFLAVDPETGGTTVRAEQRDTCWVELVPGLPARTASGALLAHADLAGTRRLTVDGRPVTPPGLQLRAVLGVEGEDVLFTASEDPAETHLWTYGPGGARRLSAGPGVHSGVRRGGTLVRVARGPDLPGGQAEAARDGGPAVPVESRVGHPVLEARATRLVLGPRELRAVLHLPSWYRPGDAPLPVLVDPYGGAGRQRVTAELDWRVLVSQWFAEQGFAVLVADGRGTPGRGPQWERAVHGDLFGPAVEDQVTALREAVRRSPALDPGRVAIRGWSFGGSLALASVLSRPDVFHAAVAGAAVTDQRLYHAVWRERVLGHPGEFPERYAAGDLVAAAPRLSRPLLLVHGLADTKVHPAHTLRMSEALLAAGRPHEVLLLPGAGHQAMGAPVAEHLLRHQLAFVERHLGPACPLPPVGEEDADHDHGRDADQDEDLRTRTGTGPRTDDVRPARRG